MNEWCDSHGSMELLLGTGKDNSHDTQGRTGKMTMAGTNVYREAGNQVPAGR